MEIFLTPAKASLVYSQERQNFAPVESVDSNSPCMTCESTLYTEERLIQEQMQLAPPPVQNLL